jgi:predicted RNase H-like nuclease (RuvC/YqgF family)
VASEEIRQTHQSVVEDLYGEIEEKEVRISSLQREIEDLRSEFGQRVQSLEMELRRRDREVQDLREHAERLRRTIITLETDRESISREASELRLQLKGAKDRLAEALIEKLDREVQGKAKQIESLEAEIENLRSKSQLSAQGLEEDDVLNGPTKERQENLAKTLLEERTATRRFVLKVTCPHCKGRISRRFKAELKSGERAFDEDELSSSTQKEIEELWVGYEQKLKVP